MSSLKSDSDEVTRWHSYDYRANSNLVLQAQNARPKTSSEPTGEPGSLKDKKLYTFGDLAQTRRAPVDEHLKKAAETKKKRAAPPEEPTNRPVKRSKTSVLESNELDGIRYQPKTKETRLAYEGLLNFVRQKLGDQQRNVIMSCADDILMLVKNEEIKPKEKQGRIEDELGSLTQDQYAALHKICQDITDYIDEGEEGLPGEDEGISVLVFGEEDEKDDENFEIEEEESEDDMNVGDETKIEDTVGKKTIGDDEEDNLDLDPNSIDAYWLQRELTTFYEDAILSQKMEGAVLDILQKTSRIGELENKLVELLAFERFDFVKVLVHNRLKILYCTKLGKAQTPEEREELESEMKKDPEAAIILRVLQGKASSESATLKGKLKQEARALKQESKRSQKEKKKKKKKKKKN